LTKVNLSTHHPDSPHSLRTPPGTGHLTGETRKGDAINTLFDQMVASNPDAPVLPSTVQRLPAVNRQLQPSEIQRERLALLEMFEAPHNLPVADYARLIGKSRRAVSYDIQAGKLLSLHLSTAILPMSCSSAA